MRLFEKNYTQWKLLYLFNNQVQFGLTKFDAIFVRANLETGMFYFKQKIVANFCHKMPASVESQVVLDELSKEVKENKNESK